MVSCYDLIIIGAGPAGLSAGLRAKELQLNYLILERNEICNTILETYTSCKLVTDFPKEQELKGNFWFERCTTEELIEKWRRIAKELNIHEGEEVVEVKRKEVIFQVTSNENTYESNAVIIAIGKEGKPRKLGVKGENLSDKVFYRLKDAKDFQGKDILIVGGGDSAVDAALSLCENNNKVTLSYRKPAFFRLNEENLCNIKEKIRCCKIVTIFSSNVKEIKEKSVVLDIAGKEKEIKNDYVFIFVGSELPIDFFGTIEGMEIRGNRPVLDENFQTSVKNLFIIGDASGKPPYLIKPAINQGYEVVNFINSKLKKEKGGEGERGR